MTAPLPPFVPAAYRRALSGARVSWPRLPAVIRRVLRTPEWIPVSEHAERYRIVTEDPHPGPWRNEITPHAVKIMDTFCKPWVREVWFCGVDQAGKTNTMLCCLHWAVDIDPGNVFYLMPTEETSNRVMREKILPMFLASKRLAEYTAPAGSNDSTLARINLAHGVIVRPAHANSAASMATFAAKHCFGDEVDKYPLRAGDETGPIELIRKRNRQYSGRYKRFFSSTPAQGRIYPGTMECRQVWTMMHRCPHCGRLFRPEASCLILPPEAKAADIGPESGVAYACTLCGAAISEAQRWELLGDPNWVCAKGEDQDRPSTVGFHLRAWDCRDVPLHEIAAAWLAAREGGVVEQVAWANGYEAVNYEPEHETQREDVLFALVEDRPEGVVPGGGVVQCLVCGSDTQDNGHYYWIDAVGWGLEQERWRIRAGFVETDAALLHAVFGVEYRDAAGAVYPVRLMVKDAMGHRTRAVYDMCIHYPGRIIAYKGMGRKTTPYFRARSPECWPGTNTPIPGVVPLYVVDSHYFKDLVATKFRIKPEDQGAWHFDAGFTGEQAAHLCAEYMDERGRWQCPPRRANHYWDSAVYAMVASEILECKFNQRPPEVVSAEPRVAARPFRPPRPARNPYTGGRHLFGG